MSHLYDLAVAFSSKTPPPGDLRSPGQNWANGCPALCNQFQLYIPGGWAKAPAAYGPTADDIGDHSGPLNGTASLAPIGAWHFFHVGTAGHVAPDLNGGGTALFMASTRAGGIDLGNALRIMSVAQYLATGGVTYRGWSTNYYGGISGYKEPVTVPLPAQRKVGPDYGAKRRHAPNIDNTGNASIDPPFSVNQITDPIGWVNGDDGPQPPEGGPWYKYADGMFSSSVGFTDQGTHDLTDLNPKPVPPDPEPEPSGDWATRSDVEEIVAASEERVLAALGKLPASFAISLTGTAMGEEE